MTTETEAHTLQEENMANSKSPTNICQVTSVSTTAKLTMGTGTLKVSGEREFYFEQDGDGSWLVCVRDAADTEWNEEDRSIGTWRAAYSDDPKVIAFINAFVGLLANPAECPENVEIRADKAESGIAAD